MTACGSGEREFDAETLVAELNEAGAGLTLGEPLPAGAGGAEVTVVSFGGGDSPEGEGQGSGAVSILEDADSARTEFRRCEGAVTFVCFRAANTVLRFDDISLAERELIATALRDLGSS